MSWAEASYPEVSDSGYYLATEQVALFLVLGIGHSRPRRGGRRRLDLLVILRPAVLLRLLPDNESPGANHGTTFDSNQAGCRIDIERDCALQFVR